MSKLTNLFAIALVLVSFSTSAQNRINSLQRENDSLKLELRLRDIDQRTNNISTALTARVEQQDRIIGNVEGQIDRWVSFTEVFFGVVGVILALFAFFGFRQIKQYAQIAERDQKELANIVQQSKKEQTAIKTRHEELKKLNPEVALSEQNKKVVKETLDEARKQLEKSGFDALKNLYQAKAITANNNQDWKNCLRYAENYLDFDDKNPEMWNLWARSMAEQNNLDQTIEGLKKIIEIDPKIAKTYNNYGVTLLRQGRHEESIGFLNKATQLDSNYSIAFLNRAIAKKELGQPSEALEDINKSIKLNPNQEKAFNIRGWLHYQLNEYRSALDDFRNAAKIDPEISGNHYGMFLCYNKLSQKENALECLNKAIQLDPANEKYVNDLKKFQHEG